MKIERINDSQIRCTLSNFDLSVRNLNLGEWHTAVTRPAVFSVK